MNESNNLQIDAARRIMDLAKEHAAGFKVSGGSGPFEFTIEKDPIVHRLVEARTRQIESTIDTTGDLTITVTAQHSQARK